MYCAYCCRWNSLLPVYFVLNWRLCWSPFVLICDRHSSVSLIASSFSFDYHSRCTSCNEYCLRCTLGLYNCTKQAMDNASQCDHRGNLSTSEYSAFFPADFIEMTYPPTPFSGKSWIRIEICFSSSFGILEFTFIRLHSSYMTSSINFSNYKINL